MESLLFEPLSEKNYTEVYEFCERETRFWSAPLEIFRRFMLVDPNFNPDLTIVARQGDKGGNLVGFIAAAKRKWLVGTRVILKAIVVASEYRRKGYGMRLLDELVFYTNRSQV